LAKVIYAQGRRSLVLLETKLNSIENENIENNKYEFVLTVINMTN
jgi:hypothetical protein